MRWILAGVLLAAASAPAVADPKACLAELDARKVAYKPARRPGIANAVEITGTLGGIRYSTYNQPLVIDCSLAVSLDEAGRYAKALGIDKLFFSNAYSVRNVKGTNRPSKHSFGLAIDVHSFGDLRVDRDYEQGLGDDVDCVGKPLTQGGATLKILQCQLVRSGLFSLVLSPDFDADHHDHFHLEAKPWAERRELRASVPAIH
jgi:hypothetical protein